MPNIPDKSAGPRWRFWLGLAVLLTLWYLCRQLPPDGTERTALAQFIGRFHPLMVHLPIALILLVPLFEWAGRTDSRSYLRKAAGFVLGVATVVAFAAAFDGWLLARSGGYRGNLVNRHLWGGSGVAAFCLAACWVRWVTRDPDGRTRGVAYPALLTMLVGLLAWTSDQGGKLSHGDTFLTQYMPARLRGLLGVPSPPKAVEPAAASPALDTLYAAKIQPLFDRSCVSCHGPEKVKGGLRLDTFVRLMKGGEDGAVVDPWKPLTSDLIRRVTLSSDDDDFMPSNNKRAFSGDDIKLIELWIAGGASDREPANVVHP